ncbi:M48 family metallopeptidase [Paraburkholderia phenazinium]|uniref:M48 family metallopeptidase n=1 Tax=Paraburkholderia phenazinium TaxID=60549 RepID=UPI003CC64E66
MVTRYYDGRSAAAQVATLRWSPTHLAIAGPYGELARWPRERLRVGEPDPDGVVSVSCKGEPGRLLTAATALAPEWLPRRRSWRGLAWAAVGVFALLAAFVVVVRLPAVAAAFVPASAENRLGEAFEPLVVGNRRICRNETGQRALEQLEARLAHAAGVSQPVHLLVIDNASVNALTLPGGRLVVMRGLIDRVENGDQLAGVLAHETGHIASRDPLQGMFRRAGIGLASAMLGFNGWDVDMSSLAGQLVGLSYSRKMESAADAHGVAYLHASGLRSDGLASFFALMAKREGNGGGAVDFLSDHPPTIEREQQNQGSPNGEHALTAEQWQAVRQMCEKR